MYNTNNIEQLTKNKQHRLGRHGEQQFFLLIYLILC